jgi:phosphoglycerate kinase
MKKTLNKFLTIDNLNLNGKTVFLRVDINCPLNPETKRIIDDFRIKASALTLKELIDKGAKPVILAHQGRPGSSDFVSLKEHAEKLRKLGFKINFINEVYGSKVLNAIKSVKQGEAVLLENVRFNPEEMIEKTAEEHSKSNFIQFLAPLGEAFINDAFSAAHRSQCSLVGFTKLMPSAAGRLMEAEIKNLTKLLYAEGPSIAVLGGAKFSSSIKIINALLNRSFKKILLTGLSGQAFLKALGFKLGAINEAALEKEASEKFYKEAEKLLETYSNRVLLPEDFAIEKNGERIEISKGNLPIEHPIYDVGSETIKKFKEALTKAKTIFASGPAGAFEKPKFRKGTEELLKAIANSKAFTVVGGGHTVAALQKLELTSKISHVSVGGGALEAFIAGESMPAIEALKESAEKFS